ncbi:MAG: hypothetical protein RLN60_01210 [Phycisphaerales bacterium]
MATFNPRRFTRPDVLRTIGRAHLIAFLERFESYLSEQGLMIPPAAGDTEIDFERLSTVLASPAHNPPIELVDALYFINDLSNDEALNALLDAAKEAGIEMEGEEHSPADVAVRVWLANPALLEQQQARQYVHRPRSFEYFPMRDENRHVPEFKQPSPDTLRKLEGALDDWFIEKKRGRGCRIQPFPEKHRVLFLVSHGDPLRREGKLEDGAQSTVLYRPVKYDVVVYDMAIGELRINAATVGEKKLYCRAFGKHLLGDPEFFGEADKYTLDPLRVDGEESLGCEGVSGIESIHLVEIHYLRPGNPMETEIRKSKDIFAGLRNRGASMPARPKILLAKFDVKFTNGKNPRRVTVTAHRASYSRDDDGDAVNQWLEARGFVKGRTSGEQHEKHGAMVEAKPVLVSAGQPG